MANSRYFLVLCVLTLATVHVERSDALNLFEQIRAGLHAAARAAAAVAAAAKAREAANGVTVHQIVLNENALLGTCTGSCDDMPTLYSKHGCDKISSCRKSSNGWNKGFVRCDYCSCICEKKHEEQRDILVEKKHLSTTEPAVLGTCVGKCSRSGLVRTNFGGCQRVENCRKARNGWTRGFVRCDYCTCDCINTKESASYKLKNVRYNLDQLDLKEGRPTTLAQTILENGSGDSQTVTRVITYADTQATSMTTSHSMGYSQTITVEASVSVISVVTMKTSVAHQLTYGYTQTAGKTTTSSVQDQIRASIVVPPRSSIEATIIGHRMTIDVPFSADLEITYTDGSTKTKRVTAVYTDVQTGRFRVQYGAAQPL